MAMEQRISVVTLGVGDLERSRAFYEGLGWRRSLKEVQGIAWFQTGGLALALYRREELARDAGIAAEGQGFVGFTLAWNGRSREEVDAALARAKAVGARIVKPAEEAFWGGYSGYFADPDGFLWEVAWNPAFGVMEDGSLKLPE
jgi:catechol 2,3-dioxygenase-like lactoylglutathione lyase family enzyme